RALHVEGREDALLSRLAIEDELRVAGALELLVDHVVHARAGVDEAGADDRQRTTFLDLARGAEEALGRIQRDGVNTTRQGATRRRQGQVVGARQAGDGV